MKVLPPVIVAPGHGNVDRRCITMTESAFSTITMEDGRSYACLVVSVPGVDKPAAIIVLDRQEVDAHIALLTNAIEDAELLNAGKAPLHAAHSLVRQ